MAMLDGAAGHPISDRRELPFEAVKHEALARAKTLLPTWFPGGSWQGAEWVAPNPKRNDRKAGSLSISSTSGKWKDFSSGEGGADLVSLHAWRFDMAQGEACKALAQDFGIKVEAQARPAALVPAVPIYPRPILPVPEGAPALGRRPNEEGRWEYRDAEGRLLLVRVRTPDAEKGKTVITWTWCETGPRMAEWRPKAPAKPWPIYGLDRLARDPKARVIVVEGEKPADAAQRIFHELVAVTSGSADSAASAEWGALAGRDVLIWADADSPGEGYAVKVAGLLAGVAASVRLVPLPDALLSWVKPGKDHPGGWDLADPVPAGVDLRAILDSAKAVGEESETARRQDPDEPEAWPEAQPFTSRVEALPYPVDALPDAIRAAVEEVRAFVQAPVPLVASSALAALSLAAQALWDVKRAEKLAGPVGLFLLTIADSGERKSTCDGFFTKVIRDYEAQQTELAKPAVKDYEAAMGAWEAQRNGVKDGIRSAAKGGKDTQALKLKLRELEHDKPEGPRVPRLIHTDITPEELKWKLAKVWPSGGVVSSEAGIVFGSHGMGNESAMRNLGTLNQLWDGTEIATERRTSESFTVRGARLSIALQVQEATLRAFFDQTGTLARGSGFMARFLVAWPESTQGSRPFTEAPPLWPYLSAFNRRIEALLNLPAPIDEDGALSPTMLPFSTEAKAEWVAFHNRIERDLPSGERLHDIRDVASKIADNAARMAALFHAFEGAAGGAVGLDSFRSAARIAEWHLNEARRFFGELALPAGLADAARLESWLVDRCRKNGSNEVPTKEVQQFGPSGLREKAKIDAAMVELEELGRARRITEGKRRFITLHPSILSPGESATAILATFATEEAKTPGNPVIGSRNSRNSSSNPVVPEDQAPFKAVSGEAFTVDL